MHEKSPYMMFALLGSLVMMMTASLVFHVPHNGSKGGLVSSILAMNTQSKNTGAERPTTLSETNQSSENLGQ